MARGNVEGPSNSVEQDNLKLCKQRRVTSTYYKHCDIFFSNREYGVQKLRGRCRAQLLH